MRDLVRAYFEASGLRYGDEEFSGLVYYGDEEFSDVVFRLAGWDEDLIKTAADKKELWVCELLNISRMQARLITLKGPLGFFDPSDALEHVCAEDFLRIAEWMERLTPAEAAQAYRNGLMAGARELRPSKELMIKCIEPTNAPHLLSMAVQAILGKKYDHLEAMDMPAHILANLMDIEPSELALIKVGKRTDKEAVEAAWKVFCEDSLPDAEAEAKLFP